MEEFHVVLYRLGAENLGLRLAKSDKFLRIDSVTGSQVKKWNERCRSCRIKQIMDHQLLCNDLLFCVNGASKLSDMLDQFRDRKVLVYHIKVVRTQGISRPHVALSVAPPAPELIPRPLLLLRAGGCYRSADSSEAASAISLRQCSQTKKSVIENYDSATEPQDGYLSVFVGEIVTVMSDSRAPPDSNNRFQCDYMFAWKVVADDGVLDQGWLPVQVLVSFPVRFPGDSRSSE